MGIQPLFSRLHFPYVFAESVLQILIIRDIQLHISFVRKHTGAFSAQIRSDHISGMLPLHMDEYRRQRDILIKNRLVVTVFPPVKARRDIICDIGQISEGLFRKIR